MKKLLVTALLFINLFSSTEFEEVYKIYSSGDYTNSLKSFQKLAEKNDYDAAYILGFMYENGEGCEVDLAKSQSYYKLSSHGYYWQHKPDPSRDINKEHTKIYNTLKVSEDIETQRTVRQYVQSLYNIKAHGENYFLPFSYRNSGTYEETNGHEALKLETEFQISIKYDYGANFLGLGEIYSVGYTQLSFWQLYADSAYFRETNYNPELFVTFPFKGIESLKIVRVAFEHESNGRGGKAERSWNYLSSSLYFQTGAFFMELKLWKDILSLEYNPNLMHYLGYGEVKVTLPYKKHIFKLKVRNPFSDKRAVEFNYSYPAFGSKDLFFYLKAFNGYGESLIDYDKKVNKLGFGFSISR